MKLTKLTKKTTAILAAAMMIGLTTFSGCSMEMGSLDSEYSETEVARFVQTDTQKKEVTKVKIKAITTEEEWNEFTEKEIEEAKKACPEKDNEIKPVNGGVTKLIDYALGVAETNANTSYDAKLIMKALNAGSEYIGNFLDGIADKYTFGMSSIVFNFLFPGDEEKSNPVLDAVNQLKDDIAECNSEIKQLHQRLNDSFGYQNQQAIEAMMTYLSTDGGEMTIMQNAKGLLSYEQYEILVDQMEKDNMYNTAKQFFSKYSTITSPYTIPMFYRKFAEEKYPFRYQSNKFLTMMIANDLANATQVMTYIDETNNPYKPNVCLHELVEAVNSTSYCSNYTKEKYRSMIVDKYKALETKLHAEFMEKTFENSSDLNDAVTEITKQELLYIAQLAEEMDEKIGSTSLLSIYKNRVETIGGSYLSMSNLFNKFTEVLDYSVVPKEKSNSYTFNFYDSEDGTVEYITVRDNLNYLNYSKMAKLIEDKERERCVLYLGDINNNDSRDRMLHGQIPELYTSGDRFRTIHVEKWTDRYEWLMSDKMVKRLIEFYQNHELTDAPLVRTSAYDGTWIIQKDENAKSNVLKPYLSNILYYGAGIRGCYEMANGTYKAALVLDDSDAFKVTYERISGSDYYECKIKSPVYSLIKDEKTVRYMSVETSETTDPKFYRTFNMINDSKFDYAVR